ncbi:MAG: nuclear transport factor 2 family protein [Pseudonocardiales bacterium]|nr:nuclear transport factor 2 family protein [Pseudonocardiales bacterium]
MNSTGLALAPVDARDWLEIVQVTTRMAWLTDHRDWEGLVEVFADHVDLDYTSLAGGEPARLAAADVVAGWLSGLEGLDATQHLVSNHLVEVRGDRAVATAQFQAVHVLTNPHGDPIWTLGGRYRFGLAQGEVGWRIDAITMTATWATGNQQIMTLAAEVAR